MPPIYHEPSMTDLSEKVLPENVVSDEISEKYGLSAQQWIMLTFSFLLGIAAVFTVDKVFLHGSDVSTGTVHAAVANP